MLFRHIGRRSVQADRGQDRLTGGADADWFWAEPDALITVFGKTRFVPYDLLTDWNPSLDSKMVDG
jgi:hypothetical protein